MSLSNGFIVLKLITSHDIPSLSKISAAYKEYLTFLEYPTIVTSFPYFITFAFPIGIVNSLSKTSYDT